MRRAASRRLGLALGGSVLVLVVWFHQSGEARRLASTSPQPPPPRSPPGGGGGDLPDDLVVRAAPPNKPRVVKTRDREADLMARMEKSMLKSAMKEEQERARLPKPQEILQEAVGPASRVKSVQAASTQPGMKLLVIAREGTGFPVLGQFLTRDVGIFEHGEPPMEVPVVGNLFNCILSPEMVSAFPQQVKGVFGESPYFREECLLDSQAVCGDPLSYESMCSRQPHQLLLSRNFPLSFVGKLLEDNDDLRVIFLIRDPRGVASHVEGNPGSKQLKQMDSFCSHLLDDLVEADELATLHPQRFAKAMYETLATRPLIEVTKLLSSICIPLPLHSAAVSQSADKTAWSRDGNSVQKVNGWKASLGGVHLQKIENQCLEVLSRLEFPLLGQGVAGAVKQQ